MSDTDRTSALKRKVKDTVGSDERFSQAFAPYWQLFELATDGLKIQSFYMRVEESHSFYSASNAPVNVCEVVAICDGLLIDLKVDGRNSYSGRTLMVKPLRSIGEARLHPGSIQNLQGTQNALLTVMTDDNRHYWFAKTDEEWRYLVGFAQCLLQAIAAR